MRNPAEPGAGEDCGHDGAEPYQRRYSEKTIGALWDTPEGPEEYVTRMGLMQISDEAVLAEYVRKAIDTHPEMVAGYRRGKLTLKTR